MTRNKSYINMSTRFEIMLTTWRSIRPTVSLYNLTGDCRVTRPHNIVVAQLTKYYWINAVHRLLMSLETRLKLIKNWSWTGTTRELIVLGNVYRRGSSNQSCEQALSQFFEATGLNSKFISFKVWQISVDEQVTNLPGRKSNFYRRCFFVWQARSETGSWGVVWCLKRVFLRFFGWGRSKLKNIVKK